MTDHDSLTRAAWRKSSFSGSGGPGGGNCVEVAALPDGRIAVRNSTDPHGPVALFGRAEMGAWVRGCRAGEFDGLA
ncbi:DUF397 domain-containing protein [Pseudonocardia acaciae]|uniref:DUF397 domain-containing protein n=1 Tax=Pseudonocardia acaciae TaxID=551276 RepID=UPI00048C1FEE|nr:DUF397 domain-containing protein [Pseudonocardia acaciae]